ncbi:cytokine inducing-glycoprotein [Trichosporon asahii var. asahii CBS 8904]|uniref:Cytokine inducing-glycoprotein n=1 Tax=Trichosporon asahii var. asahii (strain CBS 8904) TaxID=1220162 RepID=K1WE74_TRIAC|nr:cytokine inducing-glycoprotein [Trichosporon asahii var. asahii CBS 8904]
MSPVVLRPRADASAAALPSGHVQIKPGPSVDVEYPPMRTNTDHSLTYKGPCSGSSLGERTEFPLTGGKIFLSQRQPVDNINFLWTGDVSKEPHEFQTFGDPTIIDAEAGHTCANGPDFASLGFKAGDVATIMVMYQADGPPKKGLDKRWQYLCSDVKLTDDKSVGADVCVNVGEQRIAQADETMNVTLSSDFSQNGKKSASVASTSSGLSPTEAGGIGAGVTVGAFLLLAGLLFALGFRLKNKNKERIIMDDSSSTSSYPRKDPQMVSRA